MHFYLNVRITSPMQIKLPSGRHGMFDKHAKTSDTWIHRFLLLLISFNNVLYFSVLVLLVFTTMPKNLLVFSAF